MAYSLDDIFIDSIFEAKDIYDVNFKVKPNTHPILMVECSVKENQNIESIVRNLYDKDLTLFTYIGEQRKGLFTGIVQAWMRKPQVADMENLTTDVTSIKGWYKNKIAHILLIFFLSSLGGAIGNFIAVPALVSGLL